MQHTAILTISKHMKDNKEICVGRVPISDTVTLYLEAANREEVIMTANNILVGIYGMAEVANTENLDVKKLLN